MKLDIKSVALIIAVVIIIAMGAYIIGVNQGEKSGQPQASSAQGGMSPNHPPVAGQFPLEHSASSGKFSHFRVGNRNVKGMAADDGSVWVGTSGGVLRYDLASDNYELFDVANGSLLSNGVFHVSLLGDKIAVGTYGGGLSLYNPKDKSWKNYNIPQGLADQFVYDVQRVSNGDVWIATWSGVNRIKGGNLDDARQWETYNLENTRGGLPNDWVYGLEEGKDGAMWFATENGVARFKDGKWQNWQHSAGLGAPLDLVKADIQFNRDPGEASRHHARQKEEQGLQDVNVAYNPNYVVSLEIDGQGTVWGGTWGAGLARFDGTQWKNFTVKDGLPSNHVFMLYLDPQKRLWIGTSQGLARLNEDGKTFSVLTRQDGLFADNVFSMASADDGSVWVGSFGGVARLQGPL
ncbi:MAG: regulator [Gammaproteobacteria bacterium]|nr:regulator [Gammaproteobacteria bacterium]